VVTNGTVGGMRIAYFAAFVLGVAAAVVRLFLKETLPARKDKQEHVSPFMWRISHSGYSIEAVVLIILTLASIVGALVQTLWWLLPGCIFFMLLLTSTIGHIRRFHEDFTSEYSEAIRFIFKNLRGLALLYIIFNFAFTGALPLFSIYAVYFMQLGDVGWGIMYAVSYVLYLALLVPIGFMADRLGRRKMLLFSITSLAFFGFVYAVAPLQSSYSLIIMVLAYSVIVLANAAYANSVGALEADFIPREKRGRVTAALAFVASLTGAVGQVVAGFVYSSVGQRFPFLIVTVFMILCLFVILFRLKEPAIREQ
jgi:MFS family permease